MLVLTLRVSLSEHIMIDFELDPFGFLIDKIVVKGGQLEFHIIGGLIFTEEI